MPTTHTAKAAGLLSTIPRKVVILAAEPMQADGSFEQFKNRMYLGGQVRMEAAVHIAKAAPATEFIIVGGYNRPGEGIPKLSAKVDSMAAFMEVHLPNPRLELVRSLPCTRHNFIALYHYLQSTNQNPGELGLLSSDWQLERALVFARQTAQLFTFGRPINFMSLSAETILGTTMEALAGSRRAELEIRLASEQRGVRQIIDGTYEDSCLKNSPGIIEHVNLALI